MVLTDQRVMPVMLNTMYSYHRLLATQVTTSHGVDQPIGTATVEVQEPLPSLLDIRSSVTISAGYEDGLQGVIFSGRVAEISKNFDDDGRRTQLKLEGHARQLRNSQESDVPLNYLYGIMLSEVMRYFCDQRKVPTYLIDQMLSFEAATNPTNYYIRFAGNVFAGPESNVIPAGTSWLAWAQQKLRLFGYRIYDTPGGTLRVSRVSGRPSGTPVASFTEGVDIFKIGRGISASDKVNFWTVWGARFVDNNGITIAIKNSPAVVPFDPDLDPPGYRASEIRDAWIVNDNNARNVRAVAEIDHSSRQVLETWETWGNPTIAPGDTISISSPSVGIDPGDTLRWVMSVDHTISDSGYITTIQAWSGAGTVLPQADDCTTVSLGSGATFHIGDQVRDNFAQPTPVAKSVVFTISVPNFYTSMAIRGRIHGSNHGVVTNRTDPPRNLSKLEVWQGATRVSTTDLPVFFDSRSVDYSSPPTNWQALAMPLPGSLVAGTAELRIIAGDDVDLDENLTYDDFELTGLTFTTCGIGQPVLPT